MTENLIALEPDWSTKKPEPYLVDLAVGSETGRLLLDGIRSDDVRHVVPADDETRVLAKNLGFSVSKHFDGGEILFSVHWPRLLPAEVLSRYRLAVNLHPGYLPDYRGMYPVFWSYLERGRAGVTIHRMTPEVDDGPIISRTSVAYSDEMTGGDVWQRCLEVEVDMAKELIGLANGGLLPVEFSTSDSAGRNRLLREFISIRDSPPLSEMNHEEIQRLVRALAHPQYPLPAWALEWEEKRSTSQAPRPNASLS